MGKNAIRVLSEDLAQLLVARVIGDVAPLGGLRRFRNIELDRCVRVRSSVPLGLGLCRILLQLLF